MCINDQFGFSRKDRLISKQDFQAVFDNSQKITRKNLLALYRPNQFTQARLGIIISKNKVKQAVTRNLLRRLIRESFRCYKESLKELDIIVLMRSECSRKPLERASIREDLDNLWQKFMKDSKLA